MARKGRIEIGASVTVGAKEDGSLSAIEKRIEELSDKEIEISISDATKDLKELEKMEKKIGGKIGASIATKRKELADLIESYKQEQKLRADGLKQMNQEVKVAKELQKVEQKRIEAKEKKNDEPTKREQELINITKALQGIRGVVNVFDDPSIEKSEERLHKLNNALDEYQVKLDAMKRLRKGNERTMYDTAKSEIADLKRALSAIQAVKDQTPTIKPKMEKKEKEVEQEKPKNTNAPVPKPTKDLIAEGIQQQASATKELEGAMKTASAATNKQTEALEKQKRTMQDFQTLWNKVSKNYSSEDFGKKYGHLMEAISGENPTMSIDKAYDELERRENERQKELDAESKKRAAITAELNTLNSFANPIQEEIHASKKAAEEYAKVVSEITMGALSGADAIERLRRAMQGVREEQTQTINPDQVQGETKAIEANTQATEKNIKAKKKLPKVKLREFTSGEYDEYTEKYEAEHDGEREYLEDTVDIIRDASQFGTRFAADMQTSCKKAATAVKRFFSAIDPEKYPALASWKDGILEAIQSGTFSERETYNGMFTNGYSWGVEALDDDRFYVYLNLLDVAKDKETEYGAYLQEESRKRDEGLQKESELVYKLYSKYSELAELRKNKPNYDRVATVDSYQRLIEYYEKEKILLQDILSLENEIRDIPGQYKSGTDFRNIHHAYSTEKVTKSSLESNEFYIREYRKYSKELEDKQKQLEAQQQTQTNSIEQQTSATETLTKTNNELAESYLKVQEAAKKSLDVTDGSTFATILKYYKELLKAPQDNEVVVAQKALIEKAFNGAKAPSVLSALQFTDDSELAAMGNKLSASFEGEFLFKQVGAYLKDIVSSTIDWGKALGTVEQQVQSIASQEQVSVPVQPTVTPETVSTAIQEAAPVEIPVTPVAERITTESAEQLIQTTQQVGETAQQTSQQLEQQTDSNNALAESTKRVGEAARRSAQQIGRQSVATNSATSQNNKNITFGSSGETYANGRAISFKYAVMSVDNLTMSHDAYGKKNPDYPTELQPRDRSRMISVAQILKIAQKINPTLLTSSPTAQNGSPIVSKDGIVIGGNARSAALAKAYETGQADAYRAYIKEHASEFGLDPNNMPNNPVLVRIIDSEDNLDVLARQLNESTNAGYSATEQAFTLVDSVMRVISKLNLDESTNFNSQANRDFTSSLINLLPDNLKNEMVTKDTELSAVGVVKVKQALMAAAYDSRAMLENLEQVSPELVNISNALMASAAKAADIRHSIEGGALNDLGVISTILNGVDLLKASHGNEQTIGEYLGQMSMFGQDYTAEDVAIGKFFEANVRNTAQLRNMVDTILNFARNAGDPNQISFEGIKEITLDDIVRNAFAKYAEAYQKNINYDELTRGFLPAEAGSRSDKRAISQRRVIEQQTKQPVIPIQPSVAPGIVEGAIQESIGGEDIEVPIELVVDEEKAKEIPEIVKRNVKNALEQLRSAKNNDKALINFEGAFTPDNLLEQFQNFVKNINGLDLSVGKISTQGDTAHVQLYNDELKVTVDQTWQLKEASEGANRALEFVSQSFTQNVKALTANNFDVDGIRARAQASIEKLRSSLHGLEYDLTDLNEAAKNISSRDDFNKFNNQLKAAQDNVQAMRNAVVSKSSLNQLANMQRDMKNANTELETMRINLQKVGEINGVEKARSIITDMQKAVENFNKATDAKAQEKAYNQYSNLRSQFGTQLKLLNATKSAGLTGFFDTDKNNQLIEFSRWESNIKNIGMLSDETLQRIRNMSDALSQVGDSDKLQKWIVDFKKLKEDVSYESTSHNTKDRIAEIKNRLISQKKELEALYNNSGLGSVTDTQGVNVREIYQQAIDEINRCIEAIGRCSQEEVAAAATAGATAKQRIEEYASVKDFYEQMAQGENIKTGDDAIRNYYQTINSTIQQIAKLESQINSLKLKADGSAMYTSLIAGLEEQRDKLVSQVQDTAAQISSAFNDNFVITNNVQLPYSTILDNLIDPAASNIIKNFFSDLYVQEALGEKAINNFSQTLQNAQTKAEQFANTLDEKFEAVRKSAEALLELQKLGAVDANNEFYKKAQSKISLFTQYNESLSGKDPSTWSAGETINWQRFANDALSYSQSVEAAIQKEAKYFANKKQYANISKLQDYDKAANNMDAMSKSTRRAKQELEEYVKRFEGGKKIITGFTTSANGISKIDFAMFEEGTNQFRTFSAEIGQFSNTIYTYETSMKNLTSGTDAATKALSSLSAVMSRLNNIEGTEDIRNNLQKTMEELSDAMNAPDASTAAGQTRLKNLAAEAERTIKSVSKLEQQWAKTQAAIDNGDLRDLGQINKSGDIYAQMLNKVQASANGAQVTVTGFDKTTNTLTYTLTNADRTVTTMTAHMHNLNGVVTTQQGETKKLASGWQEFTGALGGIKKNLMQYAGRMFSVGAIVGQLKQGFSAIKEIDASLTELKKVTNETESSYRNFLNTASQTAGKIGSTVSDFTRASANFARLGYTMEESAEMAKTAIVYKNVAD